ncbi:MAG: hypothetical protein KKB21_03375, partial [Nanoarchaeota archaeon]|nr:hypothetical protein [Nanoarchaeota archaeon]
MGTFYCIITLYKYMKNLHKIINMALIFTLIGVFLCQDLAYSQDTYCLRVPVNTGATLERLRYGLNSASGERFSVSELYNMHSKLGLEEDQQLALDAVTGEKLKVFRKLENKIKTELREESAKRPILISCYVNGAGVTQLLDDRPEHLPAEFKKRKAWAEIKDGRVQRILLLKTKDKPEATIVMDRDPETQIIVGMEIYRKGKKLDYRELILAYNEEKLIGSSFKARDSYFQKLFDGEKEITLSTKTNKRGYGLFQNKRYSFGYKNANRKIKTIISNGLVRRGVLEEDENRPALEFEYKYFKDTPHILWIRYRLKGEERWGAEEHFAQAWHGEELIYSASRLIPQATSVKLSEEEEVALSAETNKMGYGIFQNKRYIFGYENANRKIKAIISNGL